MSKANRILALEEAYKTVSGAWFKSVGAVEAKLARVKAYLAGQIAEEMAELVEGN